MQELSILSALALALFSLLGSLSDIRERVIRNTLCGVAVVSGLALATASGGLDALQSNAIHVAMGLAGGMALFATKAIGGGDAKFYAALASWFPLSSGALYLISVSLSGLILLIAMFVVNRLFKRTRSALPKDSNFRKLPYGVAIGLGATVAYTTSNLMV